MKRTALFLFATVLVTGGPGAALLACGDTAGRRVSFETIAVSEANTFTNAFGWEITLERATLATGPFYYFEGATAHAARRLFLGTAFAHPGHYVAGDAHGEMTESAAVDLLRRNVLPRGRGVTGTLRSARFGFGAPADGVVVSIAARATKGATSITFHASAGVDEIVDPDGHPQVSPCVFRETNVASDGTVTLTLRPRVWLDQLELSGVSGDLVAAPSVYAAFARGLKTTTAYEFAYEAR